MVAIGTLLDKINTSDGALYRALGEPLHGRLWVNSVGFAMSENESAYPPIAARKRTCPRVARSSPTHRAFPRSLRPARVIPSHPASSQASRGRAATSLAHRT